MTSSITIKGVDAVLRKIDKIESPKLRRDALQVGLNVAHEIISEYPPQAAPSSKRGKYIRGKGWQTASGKQYYTSQDLGAKWNTRVTNDKGILGNAASYAPYVQGSRRTKPGQARLHDRNNWKSIDDLEKPPHIDKIVARMEREVAKAVK